MVAIAISVAVGSGARTPPRLGRWVTTLWLGVGSYSTCACGSTDANTCEYVRTPAAASATLAPVVAASSTFRLPLWVGAGLLRVIGRARCVKPRRTSSYAERGCGLSRRHLVGSGSAECGDTPPRRSCEKHLYRNMSDLGRAGFRTRPALTFPATDHSLSVKHPLTGRRSRPRKASGSPRLALRAECLRLIQPLGSC